MEFHLSPELPRAAGFVLGLSGGGLMFFSIAFSREGAPAFLGVIGLTLLVVSVGCFTFRKIVRMDKRTGTIEQSLSMFLWNKTVRYSVADFRGVGIGMAGHLGGYATSTRYLVQLLGSSNLNIPGMSGNKQAIIALAEQVGGYLNVPVDREPRMVFFQMRL
jgi:hypothetical protein